MTEPFIRPDVRAYLDFLAANPRPALNDEVLRMMRQMPLDAFPPIDEPVGDLGEIRDVVMPGPGGDIALRLFDHRKERGPGPVVVFYHGGGFIVGSIDTHAGLTAAISRALDLPVVSVEYRLAPEHKWPGAPDDAEAAARWIAENGAKFGREFTHLIPCGDSAGGNLTLTTTLALRDRPAALPVLMQFPIYPRADGSREYPSLVAFSEGYGLDRSSMTYFDQAYRPDRQHWRHSAALADPAGLPPTLLVTASLDPLRDEGRAYAARAIEAGVQVTYREAEGFIHGFMTYRKVIPSAKTEVDGILAIAKAMVAEALAR